MKQDLEIHRTAGTEAPDAGMWCGRSWQGLVVRRSEAFAQALLLQTAVPGDSAAVIGDFLDFFDRTGVGLMRDEEEWIFRCLQPAPPAVIKAVEEHIAISSLIQALVRQAQAGCVDLRVVHRLGQLLEGHLLMEEEEVRPLVTGPPRLTLAPE